MKQFIPSLFRWMKLMTTTVWVRLWDTYSYRQKFPFRSFVKSTLGVNGHVFVYWIGPTPSLCPHAAPGQFEYKSLGWEVRAFHRGGYEKWPPRKRRRGNASQIHWTRRQLYKFCVDSMVEEKETFYGFSEQVPLHSTDYGLWSALFSYSLTVMT